MRQHFLKIFIICAVMIVAACTSHSSPKGKPLAALTFAHLQAIPINVGAVRTLSENSVAFESFVESPDSLMEDYLHARFTPKGFTGILQAVVEDASITHSYEPSQSSLGSFLDVAGYDVYAIRMKVRIEHLDEGNQRLQGSVLNVGRILKISEHESMAERELKQMKGLEELFNDLDEQIRRVVLSEMGLRAY